MAIRESVVNYIKCMAPTFESHKVKLDKEIEKHKKAKEELGKYIKRQSVLVELSQLMLNDADISTMMDFIVGMAGKALRVEYCEILEFMPEHSELVLRSGVGWGDELIGTTRINADEGHAGFTLQSNKAVILEDARTEQRFKLSPLLLDRDIISGICVIIQGRDMPFGILGVHTTQFRHFTKDYVIFLQNVANILSAAIERKQAEEGIRKLNEGLEQRVLERTIELETINKELQIMLDAFVGQELRMIELKERIAELEAEIGALKTS